MAAPDFPASPTVGQIYTAPSGIQYTWDGKVWSSSSTSQSWLWTDTGTALTPYDATKNVTVTVPSTPTSDHFVLGQSGVTAKARLAATTATTWRHNCSLNGPNVLDDTTKPG